MQPGMETCNHNLVLVFHAFVCKMMPMHTVKFPNECMNNTARFISVFLCFIHHYNIQKKKRKEKEKSNWFIQVQINNKFKPQ